MTENQNVMFVLEEALRYIDLLKRSSERLKERTKQADLSAEERNGLLSEIGNMEGWTRAMELGLGTHLRERKISSYIASSQSMWTTEKEDWWLVEYKRPDESVFYSIEYVPQPGTMNVDDGDWYSYVCKRMKEAGNRIVSGEEYDEFIRNYIAEGRKRELEDDSTNSEG
jgi:hypothetical protein